MTNTMTTNNQYVTVRTTNPGTSYQEFYVNVINYNGTTNAYGNYGYVHKRSARRTAIALAKKLDVSYRQDLEYYDEPQAFTS